MNRTVKKGVGMLAGAALAGGWAAAAAGEPAFLVKDGQPKAEIVIAEKPARMTAFAVRELVDHVERMTGARLPVVTNASTNAVAIYVGASPATEALKLSTNGLSHGAFRVAAGPAWMALLGPDRDFVPKGPWATNRADRARVLQDWDALSGDIFGDPRSTLYARYVPSLGVWEYDDRGTLNAVHDFLRGLGVRWFFPGELGTVVPKIASIPLPAAGDRVVKPDFALRRYSFFYDTLMTEEDQLWQLRLGLESAPDLIGLGQACHGIKFVTMRPETKAAHPDYYAIWAGKRMTTHRDCGAPCLSSEALFRQVLKYADAAFEVFDEPILSLDVCDGYGSSLCECEGCRTQGMPERGWTGQMSDYVWGYVNRLALEIHKTHPDRRVSGLSYSSYQLPPLRIDRLSPNLSLLMCQTRALHTPESRQAILANRQAWLAKLPSKELFIWEYYLQNRPGNPYEGVPAYFPAKIAEDLRSLKGVSKGDWIEVYRHKAPADFPWDALAVMHLNVYATSRLWWDAGQDVDALMADYCEKLYGPAAAPMRAFIAYSETNWPAMIMRADAIDKALALLAEARKAAGDGIYGQRVDRIVTYTRPMTRLRDRLVKGREGVPEVRSLARRKDALKLDGKLDDPFWEETREVELREIETGREPEVKSKARVAWSDDDALVIGIRCEEPDMAGLKVTTEKNDDTNIWLGDALEVLVETPIHSYYQIVVNPSGAIMDLERDGVAKNSLWNSGAKAAVFKGDGFWSAEIRIPAAGEMARQIDPNHGIAGKAPSQTYPWYVNICRQRSRETMELSAWSPTGKKTFHGVEKFGKLYVK